MTATPDADLDDAIQSVEGQLSALFNRVRIAWKDIATSIHPDLQPISYKLLGTLVRQGPTHAGDLAELLHTDKSVVSRQLRLMHTLGLIEVSADENDGRARIISASPMAVEKVNAVRASNQGKLYETMRAWPEADIRMFAEMLSRLEF